MFCAVATRDVHEINKILQGHENLVRKTEGFQKRTALHHAAEYGDPQICRILIESGANVNKKDGRGKSPLYLAARKCNRDICRLLINHGAEISCIAQDNGSASESVSNEMKIEIHFWKDSHGKKCFIFKFLTSVVLDIYHIFHFFIENFVSSYLFITVVKHFNSNFDSEKSLNTVTYF